MSTCHSLYGVSKNKKDGVEISYRGICWLKRMRRMSRDAALVCEVFLGLKLEIADDAEVVDVCNEVRRFERVY